MIKQKAAESSVLPRRHEMMASLRVLQETPVQVFGGALPANSHPGRPQSGSESKFLAAPSGLFRDGPVIGPAQAHVSQTQSHVGSNGQSPSRCFILNTIADLAVRTQWLSHSDR